MWNSLTALPCDASVCMIMTRTPHWRHPECTVCVNIQIHNREKTRDLTPDTGCIIVCYIRLHFVLCAWYCSQMRCGYTSIMVQSVSYSFCNIEVYNSQWKSFHFPLVSRETKQQAHTRSQMSMHSCFCSFLMNFGLKWNWQEQNESKVDDSKSKCPSYL